LVRGLGRGCRRDFAGSRLTFFVRGWFSAINYGVSEIRRPEQVDILAHRAISLLETGQFSPAEASAAPRVVLGIAGSPGSGKTTLAIDVVDRINAILQTDVAAHVPMDGFHLANATLDSLGMHDRKGAIDTFDAAGFVALLRRLPHELDSPVYVPSFDRNVDEPIAGAIAISPATRVVVVEGNYLLAGAEPWSAIKPLLAETWFCATPEPERLARLIDRHTRHGRSPEAARAWAETIDGANALLIEATAWRADLTVSGVTSAIL
jgi:pantothenate kinase